MTTRARGPARGPRRGTVWADITVSVLLATATQSVLSLHPLLLSANFNLTVIRTILYLELKPASPSTVIGTSQIDMGIGITSVEAFTAGVVADPVVVTDYPSRGYLWRARRFVTDLGVAGGPAIPTSVIVEMDSSAMRKLDKGELYIVVENNPHSGAAFTVDVHGLVRTLYKR